MMEILSVITCALLLILIISYVISQVGLSWEIVRLQELMGEVADHCDDINDDQDRTMAEIRCLQRLSLSGAIHKHHSSNKPVECETSYCRACENKTRSLVEGGLRRCAECGAYKSKEEE